MFYYNPEYDFVHLSSEESTDPHFVLIDFIHDLKSYDPQGIGLLNFALDDKSQLCSIDNLSEGPARVTFVETLSQMQQLIWVAYTHSQCGLAIERPIQGDGSDLQFNYPVPVKSIKPSFDLTNRDPRPAEPDLTFVINNCKDPRETRLQWRNLLEKWDIRPAQPARERVLFAHRTYPYGEVYDIRTANEYLGNDKDEMLRERYRWHGSVEAFERNVPAEDRVENPNGIRPAIGFWLFPIEALSDHI